jgi:hypothetical protein
MGRRSVHETSLPGAKVSPAALREANCPEGTQSFVRLDAPGVGFHFVWGAPARLLVSNSQPSLFSQSLRSEILIRHVKGQGMQFR